MKAEELYRKAESNGVYLESTCVGISQWDWDKLMKGHTLGNKKRIEKIIKPHIDNTLLMGYNPYNAYKTKTHLIYVHSSIEYFFKIIDDE